MRKYAKIIFRNDVRILVRGRKVIVTLLPVKMELSYENL